MKSLIATLLILSLTLALSTGGYLHPRDRPVARTRLGDTVEGIHELSYHGRRYAAYLGIPYAQQPIGELRFEPPRAILSRQGRLNASSLPEACLQYNALFGELVGREDCLQLSVYVPETRNKRSRLPVLVWFHGGGFTYGHSRSYRARYLMDRDVILVTVNYRLNAFGFLSTGDDVVPGNMGLKDQNLALRWVNENIQRFGGDPERITIAGVSAGGASVHYHYLSPMSRGLFRNGISFSGAAVSSWSHARDTSRTAKALARSVNCTTTDSLKMVRCLKKVPAGDLVAAMRSFLIRLPFSYALFPPVTENTRETGYFVNKSPEEIIEAGEAYDVPWLIGVVQDDGLFMTAGFALNRSVVEDVVDNWRFYAPYALHYRYSVAESEFERVADATKRRYDIEKSLRMEQRDFGKNLTRMIGDEMIVAPAVRAARLQARANESPVWFYYYTYRAAQSLTNTWSRSTYDLGVAHDDDIYLVLENDYMDPTTTLSDRRMLEEMLDFWYSYASEGQPDLKVEWPALGATDFQFMQISGPGDYSMRVDNDFRNVQFWDGLGL